MKKKCVVELRFDEISDSEVRTFTVNLSRKCFFPKFSKLVVFRIAVKSYVCVINQSWTNFFLRARFFGRALGFNYVPERVHKKMSAQNQSSRPVEK